MSIATIIPGKFRIKSWKSSSGLSLVELLVSVMILGYAISAVLITHIDNMALTQAARNMSKAASHEEFVLEDIRNTSFSTVETKITNGDWNWDTATITANGLTALKNESITTSFSGTNPLTITVTVTWTDAKGRSRTQSMSTLITG